MKDNKTAFSSSEYDEKIKQTLPYYDEFYKQVIELVKTVCHSPVKWLDVGCGTGKMGSIALESVEIERFVFCDSSGEMIKIAKEHFACPKAEFCVCDIQGLAYANEFDVITAMQVNHYLQMAERKRALKKCYDALKPNGIFISFENFAPFSALGKSVYLEKWKSYQLAQGKSEKECNEHMERYNKDYFPITLTEHVEMMQRCGFKAVEILWLSNMQLGYWGIK